jgi:hypothetical protein
MNARGNETQLGRKVDWELLFISTKGLWLLLGRMGDPGDLVLQME